jgi:ankyrin repeat protein
MKHFARTSPRRAFRHFALNGLVAASLAAQAFPVANAIGQDAAANAALTADQSVWHAMSMEDRALLRRLIADGANLNVTEPLSRMTPLMAAETYEIALLLLQSGANVMAQDAHGFTPLHHAVRMRDAARIIPLLVHRGADVNAQANDKGGATPLLAAIEHYFDDPDKARAIQIIKLLVSSGAQPNLKGPDGNTALSIAATRGDLNLVTTLVDLGADPEVRAADGRTIIDGAQASGKTEIVVVMSRALASKRRSQ